MHLYSKLILVLLSIISTSFAYLNGACSSKNGICIETSTCSIYGGETHSGECPDDPYNIKCCDNIPCNANGKSGKCLFTSQCNGQSVSGYCPGGSDFQCCISGDSPVPTDSPSPSPVPDDTYNGPCDGYGGACINTDVVTCDTYTVSGRCRGPSNVQCCVQGSRPSWYINQRDYPRILCYGSRSVKTSGCGPSSLAMAIQILTGRFISPETLFGEACDDGSYAGNGFSHYALSALGQRHGVRVTWTHDVDAVFNALSAGKGVIFNVQYESKYYFTSDGHYIFLYGTKIQNGVKKVYVFDPNGSNNYINVLFPLKASDGGIEIAKTYFEDGDFGIVEKL